MTDKEPAADELSNAELLAKVAESAMLAWAAEPTVRFAAAELFNRAEFDANVALAAMFTESCEADEVFKSDAFAAVPAVWA